MANDIKRLNYFTGQFLEAQDFKDEQQYHIEMRRRLNRLLYSPGVVENGLEIKKVSDIRISVGTGFAIDALGRELFLTAPQETDVTGFDSNTVVYVALAYNERETDARSADNISGNIRITETPEIKLLKNLPAGDRFGLDIPIATVKLDANKNIENNSLATSERLMANLKVGSKKLGIGITTDPKFALSVAGAVAIGTNFANLAITDNSLNVEGNIIGKNLSLAADNEKRGALFFTLPGLYNHAVYNNNSNVDGEGKWDGIKFNTGSGINIRTGSPQNYVSSLYITGGSLVGINTTEPKSHLSVAGGLSVGATYAKTNAAPANGLLVEGNVGIGTPSPGEKLEIKSGKLQLDGNQQIKFTDADITNNLKLQLYTGYGLGINPSTLFYAANGNHSWRDSSGTNERMLLTTGTDGGLTVKGTGNSSFAGKVGIGTSSPGARLEVAGTLTATLNDETLIGLKLAPTFQDGGKTGIKRCTLDVAGASNNPNQISLQLKSGNTSTNNDSNQITFGYANTAQYRHALKTRHNGGGKSGNAIDFYVWNYSTETGAADKVGDLHTLTLDGGNVGMGTTNPITGTGYPASWKGFHTMSDNDNALGIIEAKKVARLHLRANESKSAVTQDFIIQNSNNSISFSWLGKDLVNRINALAIDIDGKFKLKDGVSISKFSDDATLSGNSNESIPTERAIKTYIDSEISKLVKTFDNHYHEYGHHIYRNVANVAEHHVGRSSRPKQAAN